MTAVPRVSSTNCAAASILGPMLPGGNWPSARCARASSTLIDSTARCVRRAEVEQHLIDAR